MNLVARSAQQSPYRMLRDGHSGVKEPGHLELSAFLSFSELLPEGYLLAVYYLRQIVMNFILY